MAVYLNAFSMWKPGQLVTINGKVYRVCKDHGKQDRKGCEYGPCRKCSISHTILPPGFIECEIRSLCFNLPYIYYFKQVYPKT